MIQNLLISILSPSSAYLSGLYHQHSSFWHPTSVLPSVVSFKQVKCLQNVPCASTLPTIFLPIISNHDTGAISLNGLEASVLVGKLSILLLSHLFFPLSLFLLSSLFLHSHLDQAELLSVYSARTSPSQARPSAAATAQPGSSSENPIDLGEGSAHNPYDLTSESDVDGDDDAAVIDEEKGICVGTMQGTNYSVWARVIGTRRVGFRVHSQDIDGNALPRYAGHPAVAFQRIQFVAAYSDKSEKDLRAVLRAILLV